MGAAVYEVRDLAYGTPDGRMLQQGVTFSLLPGQMLLITGSNGSGKSTLLRTLMRQLPQVKGEIRCSIPDAKVEYIPQLENTEVHFPVTLKDVLTISQGGKVAWSDINEIGLLNETQYLSAWNTASGGERKRTLLTRALLRKPELLIFDEPMNHLDGASRRAMIRKMARFLETSDGTDRAIIMVCHQGLEAEERPLFDVVELNLDERARLVC